MIGQPVNESHRFDGSKVGTNVLFTPTKIQEGKQLITAVHLSNHSLLFKGQNSRLKCWAQCWTQCWTQSRTQCRAQRGTYRGTYRGGLISSV